MNRPQAFGLPLLSKELIEQASRRRTYIIRTVYAFLYFAFALMMFWGMLYSRIDTPFELMGRGREMFMILMILQIFGVALFTPALTCASITTEKESNTIGLLFLTKLGPSTILLEKYLGRVFVMGTYLLISLPLFGFCYTLGGLEQRQVWFGFYALIVTVMQLAALGLLCSTFFRTTVGAFIATYLIGMAMYFLPLFLLELVPYSLRSNFHNPIWILTEQFVTVCGEVGKNVLVGFGSLFGIDSLQNLVWDPKWVEVSYNGQIENGLVFFAAPLIMQALEPRATGVQNWQVFAMGLPSIGSAVFFLLLSRLFIVSRAFITPKRYFMKLFALLDVMFHKANQNRITQGIVLIKDSENLPKFEPVAWRETSKTALGSMRYLVRIFVALEFPVFAICVTAISLQEGGMYYWHRNPAIVAVNFICWIIAILLTVVRSASLVAGERSRETLDVLLTTPISARELIRQKYKGVVRLMIVVAIPLLTGIFMQAWYASILRDNYGTFARHADRHWLIYLIFSVAHVVVYLQLFAWLSLFMGLWMKTSTRAIFASLAIIVGWMIVPIVFFVMLFEIFNGGRPNDSFSMLLISSPAMVPFFNEIGEMDDVFDNATLPALITNLMYYSAVFYMIRHNCLKYAARMLGRSEDNWV